MSAECYAHSERSHGQLTLESVLGIEINLLCLCNLLEHVLNDESVVPAGVSVYRESD